MAWHTGAFHLIVHHQLILILQCLPTLQIIPCSIIFLMLLSTFPNRPSLEMLILTGQWIFTTTALSQASPSDLLLLLRPGNVKSNLLSHSPLQKLNILLLVMLVKKSFYLCSILDMLQAPQIYATLHYKSNHGASAFHMLNNLPKKHVTLITVIML